MYLSRKMKGGSSMKIILLLSLLIISLTIAPCSFASNYKYEVEGYDEDGNYV